MEYKIKIGENNEKLSELVQKKLFEMGYRWLSGRQQVQYAYSFALYLDKDKIITHTSCPTYYINSKIQELSIEDVLSGNFPKQEEPTKKTLEPISCRVTTDNRELADFLFQKAGEACSDKSVSPYGYYEISGVAVLLEKDGLGDINGFAKAYMSWTSNSVISGRCKEVSVERFLENLELIAKIKKPIKIQLNDSYEAEYPVNGMVKVGCQEFKLEKIKELVQKCEEHGKDNS